MREKIEPAVIDDDDALTALVNLLVVLADNKWYLGLHLSEWSVGAPVLESSVACAAIAQGHMGQARVLYPLLDELPSPVRPGPPDKEGQRIRRYNVCALDEPFPTWPHVVAGLAVVDTGFNLLLEALRGSVYTALARRVGRILEEERFHREFAAGRVRELAGFTGSQGVVLLQQRVDEMLPEMLCWFGPPEEHGVEALRRCGLIGASNEQLRQGYLDRVVPMLTEVGIEIGVRRSPGGARWEYGELPWERWNSLQRRLERQPARV
jgi:ring-1,2-phenylacetyl-CoA epoxidase subunit PaaC